MSITIAGTGRYVPDLVVTNDDLAEIMETSDEWIHTRTGMRRRHISLHEPVWKMGARAAQQALDAAGITAGELDMIVCTTATPEYNFPSTACLMQGWLGAEQAFAMDIAVACAGITFSLDMAQRYLHTGGVDTVLLVGAERLSQTLDYNDRSTSVLFGDGAGAMVVRRGQGLYGSYVHTDASGAKSIYCKRPQRDLPFGRVDDSDNEQFDIECLNAMYMDGREVYKFATRVMPEAMHRACAAAGIAVDDLDLVIPHQANIRIIETAAKKNGLSMDKIYVNIHDYGNTSSASILIGLDECVRSGRLQRGDRLCMVGFGAGLTYGAAVLEY